MTLVVAAVAAVVALFARALRSLHRWLAGQVCCTVGAAAAFGQVHLLGGEACETTNRQKECSHGVKPQQQSTVVQRDCIA